MKKLDKKNIEDILELTPIQEGILFHHLKDPVSDPYFVQLILETSGEIDVKLFEKAWNIVVEANEMLRAVFRWEKVDKPLQIILKEHRFQPVYYDFSTHDPREQKKRLEAVMFIDGQEKFDLRKAEVPFRVILCKVEKARHQIIISNHHILYDGWSNGTILKEFFKAYNNLVKGTRFPLTGKTKYKEYIKWIQNLHLAADKQEKFWKNYFAGFDTPTELPIKRKRKREEKVNTENFSICLAENDLKDKLDLFVKKQKITLASMLYSAWGILLQKYTDRNDVIFGATVSGRSVKIKGIEDIVGLFISTLPLRVQSDPQERAQDLLHRIDKTLQITEEYEVTSPIKIKEYSQLDSKEELFDCIVTMENYPLDNRLMLKNSNLYVDSYSIVEKTHYDLAVGLMTFDKIELIFDFNQELFDEDTIVRLSRHFRCVVENILKVPGIHLSEIEILSAEDKKQILLDFNRTETQYPGDKTIHELFKEQAGKTPGNIALVGKSLKIPDKISITYKELKKRAGGLAVRLRSRGIKPATIVGIMCERSLEMAAAALAILEAGGAYLPIDIESPERRVKYMLDDGNAPLLLTSSSIMANYSFIHLLGLQEFKAKLHRTGTRKQITHLDKALPIPDRSLVSYEKYGKNIGMAMAKHTVALQASRGCPYKCVYCHKLWPKAHFSRSAEHIFSEVEPLYQMGVRRFVIVDDIFNLNKVNSSKFFRMIIDNKMKLQLFFPNGMRGDILSRDYIDLMIEAGTVNLALALETASPRLQQLIGKRLKIDQLHRNMSYICERHPQVILELFTMHGFPTETEREAGMTMDFVKSLKWIHLPHVNILKIYPNTDMADLAMAHGISAGAIARSENLAYHELPETLPFEKSFTMKYQADYLEYFLSKDRLMHVLPYQMKVLTLEEMLEKYNSFLPTAIYSLEDLFKLAGIAPGEFGPVNSLEEDRFRVPGLDKKIRDHFGPPPTPGKDQNALKILLMDLSQFFRSESDMLYDVSEPPLGLMYLMTYLNKKFAGRINGKVVKSRMDFDSYAELKELLEEFNPDIIGLRTLTFFNQFFHRTAALIRNWGFEAPIIAGGPYATSDYKRILQDKNVNLVVLGEGEITLAEIVEKLMENNNKMPGEEVLKEIPGIAFVPGLEKQASNYGREIIMLDEISRLPDNGPGQGPPVHARSKDPAYVMFTSGSTGQPKAVIVDHQNVVRLVKNTNFINFNQGDHLLQTAPLEFDASTFELWGSLLNGLGLFLTGENNILNPGVLKESIRRYSIDTMWMTSPLFNQIVALDIETFAGLKNFVVGGDALSPTNIKRLKAGYPQLKVINGYGPTENTTFSTTFLIDREYNESIPIGKPIANSYAYVLNKNERLMPVDVPGELGVGGAGVSRGYLNNPELTAGKFIANPFVKGDRLYKTGDMCRWMPDGNIEFSGRQDHQVKIRGIRIELGEIENRLLKFEEIKEAVVVVKEDKSGDKQLCAYTVFKGDRGITGTTADFSAMKRKLQENLPDYMIPSYFVQLPEIPLTAAGKVNRKALPAPEIGGGGDYIAPAGEIERKLVKIWSGVLNIEKEKIGIHADFFQLGGHSLRATVLVSKIHKELNAKVPISAIFENPTIRESARYIEKSGQYTYQSVQPAEKKEYYGLSPAQERMYILQQMALESTAYNISGVIPLGGEVDPGKLEAVFRKLIERRESFRTSFSTVADEPVQRLHHEVEFKIKCHLATENTEKGVEIQNSLIRPFDLSRAPLLRAALVKEGESRYSLVVDMHHIIADAVSAGVMKREFETLYRDGPLAPLRIQYKDFSQWQKRPEMTDMLKNQGAYWHKIFSGEIPVLNLPLDYVRPAVWEFKGQTVEYTLTETETHRLTANAGKVDMTLYMYILAVFAVLLSRLSGQEDIVIGTPTAGRRHAEIHGIIGLFVNTLAIRTFPAKEKKFADFLKEAKKITLGALENQEYPFEDLVEKVVINRDVGRNPLFDVMFDLHNLDKVNGEEPRQTAALGNIPRLKKSVGVAGSGDAKFDLSLDVVAGERLLFAIEYGTALFKRETVERYFRYLQEVIAALDKNPGILISQLEIIPAEEKKKILMDFNNTGTGAQYSAAGTIHCLFQDQVEKTPARTAVVSGGNQITYDEMNAQANRIARDLRRKGVKPEMPVAIMMGRSVEMIVCVMAVLKAGGAYIPLDPAYPARRIDYILEDSSVKFLLTGNGCAYPGGKAFSGEIIDIQAGGTEANDGSNPEPLSKPWHLAYVIYTSGSTGRPKGVMVQNDHYINASFAWRDAYHLAKMEISILQVASFSFDVFGGDVARALLNGGKLVICPTGVKSDPDLLYRLIVNQKISCFDATPSFVIPLMDYMYENRLDSGSLVLLIVGADTCPVEEFRRLITRFGEKMRILNSYGVTEATIDTCFYESSADHAPLTPLTRSIPIGKPLTNMTMYVLDSSGNLQPVAVPGELYIGGKGVARGYVNRPGNTNEGFLPDPFFKGERVYRTGDKARWLPEGNVEFLGRLDMQVKIRGYRIELGEIENLLVKYPGIKEIVTLAREDKNGQSYLCAYLVGASKAAGSLEIQGVKDYLSGLLPEYMIPSYFMQVEKIPITPNGKVDYKGLPAPVLPAGGEYTAPGSDIEAKLTTLWSEILGLDRKGISMKGNFFELGGHSLRATIMISKMQREFNVKVPLAEIFKNPTIRRLSAYIKGMKQEKYVNLEPVEKKEYYPLSSAQKRLYIIHRMDEDSTSYNVPFFNVMEGHIDQKKLASVFGRLAQRHEGLRTSFTMTGREPRQRIHETVEFTIENYEAVDEEGEGFLRDFVKKFDLSIPPLMRLGIVKLAEHQRILMLDIHHIISDGISQEVLIKDFAALYAGGELAALLLQYKDFAVWQTGAHKKGPALKQRHEDYWLKKFPGEIPLLNIPTDYPRPEVYTFAGDRFFIEINRELTAKIKNLVSESGTTLSILFLAAYYVLLSKYTGTEDIIVGVPASGRSHPDLEKIVGFFANMLVMRGQPVKTKTFAGFLQEVKTNSLAAYENQEIPFDELIEKLNFKREPGRHPLVDTVLVVQDDNSRALQIQDENQRPLTLIPHEFNENISHFDLMFLATDKNEKIRIDIEYRTALFKSSTTREMAEHYIAILEQAAANGLLELREIKINRDLIAAEALITQDEQTDWILE